MPEHDLYAVMQTTRAVRRLRPDPIPSDVLQRVLTAATWGPSGGNRQPWRILAVHDSATKSRMQQLYAASWTRYAAAGRVALANVAESAAARSERALAAGDYLAAHFHETPVVLVFCFDPRGLAVTDAQLPRQSVVGGASIYPAVQNVLLACRAEGLGCVLTTLLCAEEPTIRALLEIPEPWATAAFVPIGYPVGTGHGPLRRKNVEEIVFADRWGQAWHAS